MSFINAVRRVTGIITGTSILTISFFVTAAAQPGSQVQQGLVAGAPVSNEIQQKMGLVSLSSGCSGALIRQNWVLTAAHCIDKPNGAGGFTTMAAADLMIMLKGTGRNPEQRQAAQIVSFRPNDVAIVRVQPSFNGVDFNNREIYTGDMTNMTIRLFGRGIDEFSKDGNPSKENDQYRDGFVDVISTTASTFTFNARGGVMVAGGDSGGPSFVKGRSSSAFGATDMIAGVHSLCLASCAKGKTCNGAADPWEWVTSTPTCTDASIAPLWPRILPMLEAPTSAQRFDTNFKADEFNLLYTVSQDGTLTWHRHMINYTGGKRVHSFNPPKVVGSGWADGVRDVMSASLKGIYSLRDDGDLQWFWHEGFSDGTPTWRGGSNYVTTKNMQGFHHVIAQDEGVMYGRLHPNDPGIMWGRTGNYDNKGMPKTGFGMRLTAQTINFANFKKIFAGGKGVFYGISHDGRLYWMKHHRYLSPVPAEYQAMQGIPFKQAEFQQWLTQWAGPVEIQSGVGDATHAFSPGEGHLYFVLSDGSLAYTRHGAWNTTTGRISNQFLPTIDKPVPIAQGWGSYKFAFARITTSDLGSGIRGLDTIVN